MKLRHLVLAVPMLALALPAPAYIEAMKELKGLFMESDVVARGVVDAVSVEKKVVILKIAKSMKGKSAYEKIRIDLNTGPEWHPDAVLRHATAGAAVSVFYHKGKDTDKAEISIIYLNRFFLTAQPDDTIWRLGQIQTGMSKVYTGTAEELNELTPKLLQGRIKYPEPRNDFKPYTREILEQLAPPPKEGEKWSDFDPAKHLKS